MSIVSQRRDLVRIVLARLPMPVTLRSILLLLWDTLQNYGQHRGGEAAAALAYYGLFSIFPLLLLIMSVFSYVFDAADLEERLVPVIAGVIPGSDAFVLGTVRQAMAMRGALGVVALAALLWSSSGVFSALVTAISRAWCGDCGRPMWKEKLVGLILTLMAGLLIFVAIGSSSLAQVVHLYGDRLLPAELAARVGPFDLVGVALSIAVNISAFFILYKWVPALHVPWRPALLGAVVAGVVWEAAKGVFAWYLSTFAVRNFTQVYGPISAVLGLLLWTYVSAVIVLLGAELGATYVQSQNVIDSDQL